MARKKVAKSEGRPVAVNIKGSDEWKAWLERAAAHCRMSVSGLFDVAVAKYVKGEGFTEKPPQR